MYFLCVFVRVLVCVGVCISVYNCVQGRVIELSSCFTCDIVVIPMFERGDGANSHADCLKVTVVYYSRRLFVNPMSLVYEGRVKWA